MTDNKTPKRMSGAKPNAPKRGRKTPKMDKENATRMMTDWQRRYDRNGLYGRKSARPPQRDARTRA